MKFIFGLFGLFLIPGSAIALWKVLGMIFVLPDLWKPLVIGIASGLILFWLILRKLNWFSTLEHELSHAVVALAFLRKITRFRVSGSKGGYVQHSSGFGGSLGDYFISMAPYYLPLFTIICLFIKPFIQHSFLYWFNLIIGFTVGFHFLNSISETKLNWSKKAFKLAHSNEYTHTDIGKTGYLVSFIVIVGLGLFFYAFIFWTIKNGFHGFIPLCKLIFLKSSESFYHLFRYVWPV